MQISTFFVAANSKRRTFTVLFQTEVAYRLMMKWTLWEFKFIFQQLLGIHILLPRLRKFRGSPRYDRVSFVFVSTLSEGGLPELIYFGRLHHPLINYKVLIKGILDIEKSRAADEVIKLQMGACKFKSIGKRGNIYLMKGKKNNKEQEQKAPEVCAVCRQSRWENEDFKQLRCQSCSATVHKNCYYPDIKAKDMCRFKCDPCRKKNTKSKDKDSPKHVCSHCGGSSDMMKDVGSNEWMHVLCALTSPRTNLESYLNLSFAVGPPGKTVNKMKKCGYCMAGDRKDVKGEGLPCYIKDCKEYLHLTCVVDFAGTQTTSDLFESVITLGLLDKNEGSLLFWLSSKEQKDKFHGLSILSQQRKEPRYFVCGPHNTDVSFQWCVCKVNQGNEENQQVTRWFECDTCSRWYHQKCCPKDKNGVCRGCQEHDIYAKNLRLPELLALAAKTQKLPQLDKASIKFLNHFCFKPSEHLEQLIYSNSFEIQRYFLRHFLEQLTGKEADERQEQKLLQTLHYLLRRQYKKESEISSENMQEMLSQLSGKGTKFEWSQQKSEKIQKRYKDFIMSKLNRIKKDSIREIRMKLIQFAKIKDEPGKNVTQIAESLYPILQLLNQSETWNKMQEKTDVKDHHHLLQFFSGSDLSESEMAGVLKGIKILLLARNNNRSLNQNEFHSIVLKKYESLSEEKAKILKTIHMNLSKGARPKKLFETRKDQLANIQNKFTRCKPWEKIQLRNTLIKNGIMVPSASRMFKLQVDAIEADICKKQFLKNYNPPEPNQIGMALTSLTKLMLLDKEAGVLSKQERLMFEDIFNKYNFYHSLILYMMSFKRFTAPDMQQNIYGEPVQESQSEHPSHRLHRKHTQQKLEEKLGEALNEWPMTPEHTINAMNILREAAAKKIKWTQTELQMINGFFDTIVFRVQILIEEGIYSVKSMLLCQIKEISRYLGVQQKYSRYNELHVFYEEWKQDLEQKFKDVEIVLEDHDLCEEMKEVVERKMSQLAYFTQRIDLSLELRKLKILRIWIIFSQKFLGSERSTTIAAIQSAKNLMEKIQYPNNSVRKDIERLDKEARSLNKRISRFLEKSKLVDMEFCEELRFVQNKMNLKQANELQRDLQNSELDVEIELNELKEEILNACSFTDDIDIYCRDAKKSDVLGKLRKDLLECSFNVCTSSQYEALLHKYYALKCEQYQGSITKKQYFRLLNQGGTSSINMLSKTQSLFNVYKDIQNAEREVLTSKQKPQLLLSQDIRRYRNDLISDPTELAKVEKYITQYNKYRNLFASYKIERVDIEKYNQLQNQLSKVPVNSSDIISEIGKMKKELEQLITKTRLYLPDNANKNTLYVSPFTSSMVSRYQKLGMRCQTLDKFEQLVTMSQQIAELNLILCFENYKPFSNKCVKMPELWNNDEFYRQREFAFEKMCGPYLEHPDPLIEVALTLLEEGGYLIKRPSTAERFLSVLMKIHNKSYKWERVELYNMNQPGLQSEEDQEDSLEDDEDDDLEASSPFDDDEDGFSSNVDLISDHLDQEDQEGEEGPKQNSKQKGEKILKRKRPKENQCVISDDD